MEVSPEIGLELQSDEVYHWYVYGGMPPAGWAVSVTEPPSVIDGEDGVMSPAESGVVGPKPAVIVPVPPIVAVVDSEVADVKVIDPLLALHEVKDQ